MLKALLLILLIIPFDLLAIETAPLATDEQVKEAFDRFQTWTSLYQQKNYLEQYALVHPRIQRYKNYSVWKKKMNKSQHKNGALLEYEIIALSAITPDQIPCTEMGHCYRKDMQTVMFIVNSVYEKLGEKNKEYIIMTNSEQGWLFGGGTFLNIPFGETMGILDRVDEKRYEYKGITN
ncbi:MAG: hypothetical protein MUP31_07615 [Xanthomonadales bacterium]|nr:hypothetical protein [Xanthomonadales bacterium]